MKSKTRIFVILGLLALIAVPLLLTVLMWLLPAWLDDEGLIDNQWKKLLPEHAIKHPGLGVLADHVVVEEAAVTGFQDKRYLLRLRFKDGRSGEALVKSLIALGAKASVAEHGAGAMSALTGSDKGLPAWWAWPAEETSEAFELGNPPSTAALTLVPWVEQGLMFAVLTEF